MVVIGGAGTRWGAVLGGVLYTFLDNRLLDWSDSATVQDLPDVLRDPAVRAALRAGHAVHPARLLPAGRPRRPRHGCGRGAAAWRCSTSRARGDRRARGGGSGMKAPSLQATNGEVRIAYEVRGAGPPSLLDAGPGLRALGLGAGRRRCSPTSSTCCSSTTAASARATCLRPVHGPRARAGRRRRARRSRRRPRERHRNEPRRDGRAGAGGLAPRSGSTGSCSPARRRAAPPRTRCRSRRSS